MTVAVSRTRSLENMTSPPGDHVAVGQRTMSDDARDTVVIGSSG
jgi:hypothetical protein